MKNEQFEINGFLFENMADYELAKKEQNNIIGLKNRMNMDDIPGLKLVYEKLVAKNYFHTVIGISFLSELREYIVKSQGTDDLSSILIQEVKPPAAAYEKPDNDRYIKLKNELDKIKSTRTKLVITICALAVIIIGMVIMTATNDNSGFFNAEEKVLDKYSAWQEQLLQKEQELKDWEDELRQKSETPNMK